MKSKTYIISIFSSFYCYTLLIDMNDSCLTDAPKDNASKQQSVARIPQKIGDYFLGKTLGKGTFGKVKQGTHIKTGQKVAIKIIDKSSIQDEDDEVRIQRQVDLLKKVRHPNIVYLYEIIETSDHVYIITEFAEQGELFSVMRNEVRLKERTAGRIFFQILNAVQYLHRLKIAHRDLKPQNILLDTDYNVKLIDFGLSNYNEEGKLLHTACGSPCYAPPEMVSGKSYNGLIGDIWSLGIIFYGMVCGSLPFEEKTTKELYKKVIQGFYVLPSDISVEAIEVIQKMLVTDPNKRITIPQIKKLKFFNDIKKIEPEIVGLIVGFHAMPIDNEIIEKMKEFTVATKRQIQDALKQNLHNEISTLYYLLQKKTLRDGKKTICDLQAYLQSSSKYKSEYGKESLRKYRKLILEEQLSRQKRQLSREKLKIGKSQDRNVFSVDKYRRKISTESKHNLSVNRKAHTILLKTQRSMMNDPHTPVKNSSREKYSSPVKSYETQRKKVREQIWKNYMKDTFDTLTKNTTVKKHSQNEERTADLSKRKERYLKLPNMLKKYKLKRQNN